MSISAILLAAGGSRRMGAPKQLIEWDGKTLLRRSAERIASGSFFPAVVVIGPEEERMRNELRDLPVTIVSNREWQTGIASSIRAGLAEAVRSGSDPEAVLITLCDQPLVTGADLQAIVELYRESGPPIVASCYGRTSGVPALFDRSLFGELEHLQGDEGARRVLAAHQNDVALYALPAASIDLDTPADVEDFSANLH